MTHLDLESPGSVEATQVAGIHVISLHGYADERLATELDAVLAPLAASDGAAVVLDLEDAVGLDGVLLSVVANGAHNTALRGERLAIITRSQHVTELVHDSGLDDIVSLHTSLREAVPRA